MRWLRETSAVFAKEIKTEWRTRVAVSSVTLFALGALTLIALALRGDGAPSGTAMKSVAAALLWLLLFFTAATGLGRTFVQEEERGTSLALRLSARATTVWTGKFAANAALLGGLTLVAAPTLLGILGAELSNPALLFCVLLLGVIGLAAVFTLVAALVAQASARSGLLAALAFPLLVPLLVAGVHGTRAALGIGNAAGAWAPGMGDVRVLFSYAVIAITTSLMLFDFVWND